MVKADNEDKQDAIMLADADNQEDPDNEQLDMQQDDNQPEDNVRKSWTMMLLMVMMVHHSKITMTVIKH